MVALALVAALVPVPEAQAVPPKEPRPVESLTTETSIVHEQPDGTMTATLSAVPVRVKDAGGWKGVDTTLVRHADGLVRPKTAAVGLALSGGGEKAPLARLEEDGKALALSWPGPLPEPSLAGPVATYAEVLPGVDLRIRADAGGYVQHLVVKNAEAARALKSVRYAVTTTGVRLKPGKDGGLLALDAAGKTVFSAPASAMWDAAGQAAPSALHEPDGAARRAVARTAVEDGAIVVTPDRAMLTDPATRYPVVIDPDWESSASAGWGKVFSGKPGTTAWLGGQDGGDAKVGQCYPSPQCNGIGAVRTYFQFDTGALAGKQILGAWFNISVKYGPTCPHTARHQLFIATGQIGPGTNWSNAPQGALLDTKPVDTVYGSCSGWKGVGFGVGGNIRAGGISTYFLKAENEGDGLSWRKYATETARLIIKYNTRPNAPYDMGTDPPLPAACRWCEGRAWVGDERIRLLTRLSDPDGDQVRPIWDIYTSGERENRDWGPTQSSGAMFSTDLDLTGRDGKTVDWTAWAADGNDGGPWAWGPGGFVVDRTGITTAPAVSSPEYPGDNRWHGGVDVPGTFTFTAAGVPDVDHYLYNWNRAPYVKVDADALGGKASVTATPPGDGPQTLAVQSVDRAGHRSPITNYRFYVRGGNGPLAHWRMDGSPADSAFLGDRDGTLHGSAGYVAGAVGSALRLDGSGAHFSAPHTVRTDVAFSASAWVKADEAGRARSAVSQENGFDLGFRPADGGRWAFTMGADTVASATTAKLGTWTHLAAVYEPRQNTMTLYVNGVRSGSLARTAAPSNVAGPVRAGGPEPWSGAVDEVRVYDRALAEAEVKAAVGADNVQTGHWKFDDRTGTTAVNEVQGGQHGVLSQGASFIGTGASGGSLRLDGRSGQVSTSGPVVATDQSFSAAAWVYLDQAPPVEHTATVVSQDGQVNSGFMLGYRRESETRGSWEFFTPGEDAPRHDGDVYARSSEPAQVGAPTHLAAVYDAPARQLRLYVNGRLAGSAARPSGFDATGAMLVGRHKWNTAIGGYWPGWIDDLRTYSRALASEEIQGIVGQANVTSAYWKLDGSAKDESVPAREGELRGGAAWTAGQSAKPDPDDLALRLDGKSGGHLRAGSVVDTTQSFAVAAWARLDGYPAFGQHPAVISQDGARSAVFQLQATPTGNWAFTLWNGDGGGDGRRVTGPKIQSGVWTHLVAMYDAGARRMSLFVNGKPAGTEPRHQTWNNPSGSMTIGRSLWEGAEVDFFAGAVDDVAVYNRVLFDGEISTMAGRDLALVHNWTLDEPSGTGAADSTGARTATLAGDARFVPGRSGNAIALDGAGDHVSAEGVDLRTDQAFTVSAWVNLTGSDCDLTVRVRCKVDAVSLDGDQASKFRLGHVRDRGDNLEGTWTFEMTESDAAGGTVTKAAVSGKPGELTDWVHLTGVYQPEVKKIWLYVDGVRVGDGTQNTQWHANGALRIGRGKADEYWRGKVDDVRLYAGALSKERVFGLYGSYPAQAGAATLPRADLGAWKFDEGSGPAAADAGGRNLPLTLKGGATWHWGRYGHAVALDGNAAYAETAGPVVDTGRSFSVAAWAHLSGPGTANRVVIGQDGNRVSTFMLMYDAGKGRWAAAVPDGDTDNPQSTLVYSAAPAATDDWTHLVLSYDAARRQLRLYVNGLLSGAQTNVTVQNAPGPLTVGRAKWNGAPSAFFPKYVDDVRVYGKALSDGEAGKVYDDIEPMEFEFYRFDDGTTRDTSWRGQHLTATGGAGFAPGVQGQALKLDGVNDAAVAATSSVSARGSFGISAWVKLARTDQVATVVSQGGRRMSAFALQYRPGLNRWVFGGAQEDADGAAAVHARSRTAPRADQWTHLMGVYDFPARQLRLYVNGEFSGSRDGVTLWAPSGELNVGRDLADGQPAGYFPGLIDDLRIGFGALAEPDIAVRGGYPKPQPGQLGRFVNAAGEHYTAPTGAEIRPGYHFEGVLGLPAVPGPGTTMLYSCEKDGDLFTSAEAGCEGGAKLGEIGLVRTAQTGGPPAIPIYRCASATERFESRDAQCEGVRTDKLLGYTTAYAVLARYNLPGYHHRSLIDGPPPGHKSDGPQGYLALTHEPGTQTLMSCGDGSRQFVSTDQNCEGKTVLSWLGKSWTQPPQGRPSHELVRCTFNGGSFVNIGDCGGYPFERSLGHVPTTIAEATS